MEHNALQNKSQLLAIDIVTLCKNLRDKQRQYELADQLIRCTISIGANIECAKAGLTKKVFNYYLNIAYKEGRECKYWLRLLYATNFLQIDTYTNLFAQIESINKMLYKSIETINP